MSSRGDPDLDSEPKSDKVHGTMILPIFGHRNLAESSYSAKYGVRPGRPLEEAQFNNAPTLEPSASPQPI
jgi:hypothetical protein